MSSSCMLHIILFGSTSLIWACWPWNTLHVTVTWSYQSILVKMMSWTSYGYNWTREDKKKKKITRQPASDENSMSGSIKPSNTFMFWNWDAGGKMNVNTHHLWFVAEMSLIRTKDISIAFSEWLAWAERGLIIRGKVCQILMNRLIFVIILKHLRDTPSSTRRLRGTKSLSRTFSWTVPSWWNDLPISIRTAESLAIFKKHLKTHLFRQHLTN